MLSHLTEITRFILENLLAIWPYLLLTIPLAVAVRLSGAARFIDRAFQARPVVAILLATVVGAFSPFCSCSVIPVVASLLIGGVPLAPVMAFWIASPSMDPEIFFLSVATIGWKLALWRLGGTVVLSLGAGFITQAIVRRGWLGQEILRRQPAAETNRLTMGLKQSWQRLQAGLASTTTLGFAAGSSTLAGMGSNYEPAATTGPGYDCGGGIGGDSPAVEGATCGSQSLTFRRRLLNETWAATLMVAKFMLLAYFLEALLVLYVPETWIAGLLGRGNSWAIISAALIGVPVYTSNLAALPLVGGLLTQGMHPGAALAFLIAGPTTTLPAMAAVWSLTTRRVFALYLAFALVGAILLGYLFAILGG